MSRKEHRCAQETNRLINLFGQKRYAEAESLARDMTESFPQYGFGWKALGATRYLLGRTAESLDPIKRAATLLPADAGVHNSLGNILKDLGRLKEAEASYRRALAINPEYAEAHGNLGNILRDRGRLDEAQASYRRALEINPEFASAYSNLGNTLKDLGRLEEAEANCRKALEIKPNFADAYNNLGNTLKDLGRLEEAEANYRRALEINPECAEAHSNLLFSMNYADCHRSRNLEEARKYGRMVARKAVGRIPARQFGTAKPDRLRVGIVSGDLRNHPVCFFLENVLTQIDPARIELIAYPTGYKTDEQTSRIRPCFCAWKPLAGLSDEAAAHLIHADGIHLLLDLSGHTAQNRLPLFAWKPAPVQVSWLGCQTTTGVAEMDYMLGDPYVTPPEEEWQFTETIWRMPEIYCCFSPPHYPLEVGPLPSLSSNYITFGNFNNLTKMNDAVVSLWAKIIQAIPSSRLLLKANQLNTISIREVTRKRFVDYGISPDRILLEGSSPRGKYLEAYNRVDIALDPFPYPGVTTSVEGLWMGVPVISRRGSCYISRVGESIAKNIGMAEWNAADDDDYVAKAVAHTTNLDRLANLRSTLRRQVLASPLFNAPRFARHFETALWEMWDRRRS